MKAMSRQDIEKEIHQGTLKSWRSLANKYVLKKPMEIVTHKHDHSDEEEDINYEQRNFLKLQSAMRQKEKVL